MRVVVLLIAGACLGSFVALVPGLDAGSLRGVAALVALIVGVTFVAEGVVMSRKERQ